MRAVIQRVSRASVGVDGKIVGRIGQGILMLVGFEEADSPEELDWMVGKVTKLRIFNDSNGVMNLDIQQVNGNFLIVSQFTLHASTKKGNRPSYIRAASPSKAIQLYNSFIYKLEVAVGRKIEAGIFGAMMNVSLENDGPVTLIIDTKNKE